MLNDSRAREEATNPRQSYIVQAPAGSGKTEILTQRYLRLLSGVHAPEQIIALTFTRKAANEMRERILHALQKAAINDDAATLSPHQQQTRSFAIDALARDKALNWQIINQPGRLRIITIDALCQTLSKSIPLLDKHVPYAEVSDKPDDHYRQAARATFAYAVETSAYQEAMRVLLQHVDNHQDKLLALFSDLLAHRAEWLHLIYQAQQQDKKTHEKALFLIEQHELMRLQESMPPHLADELMRLSRQLATIEANPSSPRYPLREWREVSSLNRNLVQSLAALILTSQETLRKSFDHHVGLKRGVCDDNEYNELKAGSQTLLSQLDALPDFLDALLRVKQLPEPLYEEEQWHVLQALFSLLPLLAAHLQLIFRDHNAVDFTAITLEALDALGEEEAPTDLALYLDHSIHHILVDEFQDTSIQQFQLLSQLVQSWQPHEERTLFVVGDPMQSIYRFRAAEVGLFLRAKQQGIGPVTLTPLELTCNFRSTQTIVDWVNAQFQSIFPPRDDIESGAVSFHPSVSTKKADDTSQVLAFQEANKEEEATALIRLVQQELEAYPTENMAILVRSRSQLKAIMRGLRDQAIPFQGVDIDPLATLPHLRDVWSLTQALLMPANRVPWLAFLRSPWCGLSLSDLHGLVLSNTKQSILLALSRAETNPRISEEGRLRIRFIHAVLQNALRRRHQQSLVQWVSDTLNALHLDLILTPREQHDLEQYWLLLDQFEQDGQLDDLNQFNHEFKKLYSQQVVPSRLQIMTIHKSKGLEFDTVILPGLSTSSANQDTPMLRWLALPTEQSAPLFLISPMKAAHRDQCLLYDYLGSLEAQKHRYELQRLFYVAVTRAKKRLYLFDHSEKASQHTFRHLLKKDLFTPIAPRETNTDTLSELPALYHLPVSYYEKPPALLQPTSATMPLPITASTPRLLGTVMHELLQWICDHHPTTAVEVPLALATHALQTLGLDPSASEEALSFIKKQLTDLFHDPVGQWIIKAHEDEHNEYECLLHHQGSIVTQIIDRTFREHGLRWIIDFKTGHDQAETQAKHRQQVNAYAHLWHQQQTEPIRCGLYYLNNNQWVTWEYTTIPTEAPMLLDEL